MKVLHSILCAGLALAGSSAVYADDDSSSDTATFAQAVADSEGVVVRVPVNERGEELTSAAEMRLVSNQVVNDSATLSTVFSQAVDLSNQPVVDPNHDSSTNHDDHYSNNNGWSNYHYNNGYQHNYYNNYQPRYYYQSYTYSYRVTYNYTYWSSPSYGYRYYYYQRCW